MKDIKFSIKVMISFLIVIFISFSAYSLYLINNSPLDAVAGGWTVDKHVLLVQVGNKSRLAKVSIKEVLVNDNNEPREVKIQESNSLKGFIISSNFEGEEESKYNFRDLNSVGLQTNSDPQKQLDKLNKGTATKDDKIYAISIINDEIIHKVIIKYRFLWLSYEKVIST
ncbi:hypothetical protein [Cohnella lupini]|uniref:Uncharacterized protein n=1 Tax=Cohnella lupini TaxID=1294267 RepID=A0A3D9HQY5_9BACL|nr:hypothetical protein [Cohnella lupini]RED51805.1 hypothetical protein DFP95_13828 [Cohnella lupini]